MYEATNVCLNLNMKHWILYAEDFCFLFQRFLFLSLVISWYFPQTIFTFSLSFLLPLTLSLFCLSSFSVSGICDAEQCLGINMCLMRSDMNSGKDSWALENVWNVRCFVLVLVFFFLFHRWLIEIKGKQYWIMVYPARRLLPAATAEKHNQKHLCQQYAEISFKQQHSQDLLVTLALETYTVIVLLWWHIWDLSVQEGLSYNANELWDQSYIHKKKNAISKPNLF